MHEITAVCTALNRHCGYMSLMSRLTIVTSFLTNCLLLNHHFMWSEFFRVNCSKFMPPWRNVCLINVNTNLLRHWVKLCAEIIRHVGYSALAWSGL